MTPKYKYEILEKIKRLNNKDLLEETLELAAGDDYDGNFTPRGRFKFENLLLELKGRLKHWFGEE